jgi:hypothetical protein
VVAVLLAEELDHQVEVPAPAAGRHAVGEHDDRVHAGVG